ncbi:hypothetical protein RD792_009676 [Penstemon davidsonii]|uniref:GATA-type domain-containing protein n=1 Tax=Penstemon davidsonii TaxID=160366 RepID=A0ABR0CZQ7_9LAMI|nr:hypothetical protein RD792_009676 [Penstemon davidsonii]
MDILDPTQACFMLDDDLFNFTLDGEEDEGPKKTVSEGGGAASASSYYLEPPNSKATTPFGSETQSGSFPDVAEEELEWISNKDAFPSVDTCFSILPESPELTLNHLSPISVLENSSNSSNNSNTNSNGSIVVSCCDSFKVPTNYPVRARSRKRRRKRTDFVDLPSQKTLLSTRPLPKILTSGDGIGRPLQKIPTSGDVIGRRCLHCQVDKTPQWRAGPMGPKTLCNACGVRYKSGRLLPEYRPANSPTFSSALHSNSHRKVVEMRKQKQVGF